MDFELTAVSTSPDTSDIAVAQTGRRVFNNLVRDKVGTPSEFARREHAPGSSASARSIPSTPQSPQGSRSSLKE